jgi:hypothetical protein
MKFRELCESTKVTFHFFFNDGKDKIVKNKKEAINLIGSEEKFNKIFNDAKKNWESNKDKKDSWFNWNSKYSIPNGKVIIDFH